MSASSSRQLKTSISLAPWHPATARFTTCSGGRRHHGFGVVPRHRQRQGQPRPECLSIGFDMSRSTFEEGLVAMTWGKTFMLRQDDRSFHGIYVGAGPYFAVQANSEFDTELVSILNASGDRYIPAATFGLAGGETTSWPSRLPEGITRASRCSPRTARVPAAMGCMSPRITITCGAFAWTISMRGCNWRPTRLV